MKLKKLNRIKNNLAGIHLTIQNLLNDLENGAIPSQDLRTELQKIQVNADLINQLVTK